MGRGFYGRQKLRLKAATISLPTMNIIGGREDLKLMQQIGKASLSRASNEGVGVKGYFHWSLLDNFEWTQGFSQCFGLIYVDYKTQKRILKASAARYTQIIRSQGAIL